MTGSLTIIRNAVDKRCLTTGRLRRKGCTVNLTGTPQNKVIVDLDSKYSPLDENATRCDYVYASEDDQLSHLIPLELKRGDVDSVKDVRNQLQAGASFCQALIPATANVKFVPVVASGSLNKHKRNQFRQSRNRIKFHQESIPISLMKCGENLARVLGLSA